MRIFWWVDKNTWEESETCNWGGTFYLIQNNCLTKYTILSIELVSTTCTVQQPTRKFLLNCNTNTYFMGLYNRCNKHVMWNNTELCYAKNENITTVDVESFAGLNIRGSSPMKFFAEILLQYIGHQCSLLTYS